MTRPAILCTPPSHAQQMAKPSLLHLLEATSAGAARFVCDVLLNIDLGLFDVSFAYSLARADQRFREDLRSIRDRGVTTYEIPMVRGISPSADGRAFLQVRRLLRRERFDLVHAHSSKAGFLGRLAARSVSRRIVTVYSPHAIAIPVNRVYGYLEHFAALFTDAIVGVSRSERDELSRYRLLPSHRLHHVTAAIDVRRFTTGGLDGIRQTTLPPKAILIGTAGRLSRQKDPLTFLEIAKTVIDRNPLAYFVWIGDGDLRRAVEQRIQDLGVGNRVAVLGYRKEIVPLLSSLDIFLLTSRYESFGYVTCEAMALGKPVVATHVSGSSELVDHEHTGFLAPPGDVSAMARHILDLAQNDNLRARMGAAGRQRVEEFYDLPRMIHEIEHLYRRLLKPNMSETVSIAELPLGGAASGTS